MGTQGAEILLQANYCSVAYLRQENPYTDSGLFTGIEQFSILLSMLLLGMHSL